MSKRSYSNSRATRAIGGARASTSGTRTRKRGARWLLFGDQSRRSQSTAVTQDEFQSTQGALEDDE